MKNEFTLAFNEVIEEKQLSREIILKALESAMISAYRRSVNASNAQHVDATVDTETGKVTIFAEKEVVDSVQDERTEVTLDDAKKVDPNAELGGMVIVESTPKDFGRVAAQTARQVIQQRIRDAERQSQLDFYQKQVGEIVSGLVQAVNSQGMTIGLEMKAEGTMLRKDMIQNERFRLHDRVRALIAEVKDSPRGPQIMLSRTHRNFLRRLLENEVPEIYHGVVEIRSIAREPGERAKVAVSATQHGIDPVGACVGIKGVRIQAIVRELHDEKIDVIEWNPDPAAFIAKAISPARVTGVYLNERSAGGKTATVVVSEDQLSLAIGRDGQNARLAAKLTGWRIDIKSLPEAAADVVYKLQKEDDLADVAKQESETLAKVQELLARRAEGRPLAPEEYEQIARFIDRVERHLTYKPEVLALDEDELAAIKQEIPANAFNTNILDCGLPEHVAYILQEAGYATLGDMAVRMKANPDDILRLSGIGPRAMQELHRMMESLDEQRAAELMQTAVVEEEPVLVEETPVEPAPEIVEVESVVLQPSELETAAEELVTVGEISKEPIEGEEPSFDNLFKITPDVIDVISYDEEEEESTEGAKDKKKGKKKKKHTQVEFDPERGETTVRKKHRRDGGGWDWDV